jgi:hypothetical protein
MKRMTRHGGFATGALLGTIALALVAMTGAGTAAQQDAPANTTQPTIQGSATVGSTLTATQGAWSGNPSSFTFQWVRCPSTGGLPDGSDCAAVGGASTQAYVVNTADVGFRLRVRVTATNADGSATAASNATALVGAASQPPTRTADPTIAGTPRVGSTLVATQGQWTNSPLSFAYQWVRCPSTGGNPTGSDCAAIGGATTQAYQLVAADVGQRLRVRVTATNPDGSATAASNATAIIQAAPPAPPPPVRTGCPAGTDPIRADQISPPARLQIDRQVISPSVATASTTSITARFRVSACGGRPVQGMLVFVTAVPYSQFSVPPEATTGADGFAELRMNRLRGYPATPRQQLLVLFVRARKNGESLLGGISTRRLVSFPVSLR